MTPSEEKAALRLYVKGGLSAEATARELKRSTMTVYNFLLSKGVNRRIPQHKSKTMEFLDQHRTRVLVKYKTMSAQQIATAGNLSLRGVIAWLKREGVWHADASTRTRKAMAAGLHSNVALPSKKLREILLVSDSSLDELHYLEYCKIVNYVTSRVFKEHAHLIDPKGLRSYEWHLDHIYSVKNATHQTVNGQWVLRTQRLPLRLLCHPANLRILSREENARRHNYDLDASSITKLRLRIKAFNKRHGDPFKSYDQEI